MISKNSKADYILIISLPLAALVLTLLIEQFFNAFDWWKSVISLSFVFIFVLLLTVIHTRLGRSAYKREARTIVSNQRRILNELEDLFIRIRNHIDTKLQNWIFDTAALVKFESKFPGNSIWIVSPDLSEDTDNGHFCKVVCDNVDKGISYVYFLPDTTLVRGRLQKLRSLFAANDKLLTVVLIPERDFDLLTFTHVALYHMNEEFTLFFELPIEGREHWIKPDKRICTMIYSQLSEFKTNDNNPR